ncbi:MAG TPA: hypothetical protein PK289_10005 [Bacteroidia bacterium]|nr:hypothetical protein [Bacteroidia bacterium]HRG53915.1 hypothetical protein [Bacteroidia bacterium]
MKTYIYYILLSFGIFLAKPIHGHTLQSKYINSHSFEKTEQQLSFSSNDLKKSFFFSNEDLFNEDDDDHFSAKKKITFIPVTILSYLEFFVKPVSSTQRSICHYTHSFELPRVAFISLNILKI